MILSEIEKQILAILRELKPFEHIDIGKDKNGKIDSYIIHRSQKIVLTDICVKNQ